jgi:delta 1-pyrroline-5-carboxylate dehydrogenase
MFANQPAQINTAKLNFEVWDSMGARARADKLMITINALAPHLKNMALWQITNALNSIADRQLMPGPTGESNELSNQGRGLFLCSVDLEGENISLSEPVQIALVGQIYAALIAGNSVINVGPFGEQLTDIISAVVPTGIIQNVAASAEDSFIDSTELAGVAMISTQEKIIQLNQRLTAKDGVLCQLVAETDVQNLTTIASPYYLLRFITERTVTINTTAVGGNATLLELGSKED